MFSQGRILTNLINYLYQHTSLIIFLIEQTKFYYYFSIFVALSSCESWPTVFRSHQLSLRIPLKNRIQARPKTTEQLRFVFWREELKDLEVRLLKHASNFNWSCLAVLSRRSRRTSVFFNILKDFSENSIGNSWRAR